jgi:hypothetical protein
MRARRAPRSLDLLVAGSPTVSRETLTEATRWLRHHRCATPEQPQGGGPAASSRQSQPAHAMSSGTAARAGRAAPARGPDVSRETVADVNRPQGTPARTRRRTRAEEAWTLRERGAEPIVHGPADGRTAGLLPLSEPRPHVQRIADDRARPPANLGSLDVSRETVAAAERVGSGYVAGTTRAHPRGTFARGRRRVSRETPGGVSCAAGRRPDAGLAPCPRSTSRRRRDP